MNWALSLYHLQRREPSHRTDKRHFQQPPVDSWAAGSPSAQEISRLWNCNRELSWYHFLKGICVSLLIMAVTRHLKKVSSWGPRLCLLPHYFRATNLWFLMPLSWHSCEADDCDSKMAHLVTPRSREKTKRLESQCPFQCVCHNSCFFVCLFDFFIVVILFCFLNQGFSV